LQELRDISSMAMEYFDEKIVPTFKLNMNSSSANSALLGISPSKIMSPSRYLSLPLKV
jgi:F-box protein 28